MATQAELSGAERGTAWFGKAGKARLCRAERGLVRQGTQGRRGLAGYGVVEQGRDWRG